MHRSGLRGGVITDAEEGVFAGFLQGPAKVSSRWRWGSPTTAERTANSPYLTGRRPVRPFAAVSLPLTVAEREQ
jgi:hypothetical protein